MGEPVKKKVKTSLFQDPSADELPQKSIELRFAEAPVQQPPKPEAVSAQLDLGTTEIKRIEGVDVGVQLLAVPEPKEAEPTKLAAKEPAATTQPEVRIDPDTGLRLVNQELQVYQGSLTMWAVGACLMINLLTQGVKFLTKYPLHEKDPPTKVGKWTIGGWSAQGYAWFIKLWPFVFAMVVAPWVIPPMLDALGFPGEYSGWQTLWFSPFLAGGSLGVWAILPEPVKKFLNREKDEPEGLATNSDVTRVADDIQKVMKALEDMGIDTELKETIRSATQEHSSVVDVFDAETLDEHAKKDE